MKTHYLSIPEFAYDQTQSDDSIQDGDLLVVKAEQVVGFLYKAWPVALTVAAGQFHTPTEYFPDYAESWAAARKLAGELGFPLQED